MRTPCSCSTESRPTSSPLLHHIRRRHKHNRHNRTIIHRPQLQLRKTMICRSNKHRRNMRHLESQIQIGCVQWFRLAYPQLAILLFAVPNGGARKRIEGAIMKAEGTQKGVADLLLLFPSKSFHGLCIEMKTPTGKQQPSQKIWQRKAEWAGYKYVICRSFEDFKQEIEQYLHEKA